MDGLLPQDYVRAICLSVFRLFLTLSYLNWID